MAKLDISWLAVFIEIYKTQSVSLAAERLGITQARASGVLGKLRRYFGDALFARTSRGMEPTPYAERTYPDIVQVFGRLCAPKSRRDFFDPATAGRQFHICMTDISEIVVLPSLAREIRRLSAGVTIEAERISSASSVRLESGDVDLAVGYMPSLEAGFYQQGLFKQGFVCLASKHHPRIRERPNILAFCREGHIVVTTSGTGHSIVDKEFAKRCIHRDIVLRVPSFLGVARLVARTELLAIVPRRLAEVLADQEEINIFGTPIPLPSYMVKLHWHARFHADPGNIWIRQMIARVVSTTEEGASSRVRVSGTQSRSVERR
jgi:DNA-binding transcriptional LysR family regulator